MRRDRSQAVVSGNATADLDANLGRWEFDLVVKHHDITLRQLEELRGVLNRVAGVVNVGRRLEQDDPLPVERAFGSFALKAAAPRCETVTPRNLVHAHEPDVVSIPLILRAGISQSDEQAHDAEPLEHFPAKWNPVS